MSLPPSVAGAALGLALSAQVVAHMLHMAAMPAAEVTAAEQMRDLEEMATYLAGELANALDLAGRQLVSKSHGIRTSTRGWSRPPRSWQTDATS